MDAPSNYKQLSKYERDYNGEWYAGDWEKGTTLSGKIIDAFLMPDQYTGGHRVAYALEDDTMPGKVWCFSERYGLRVLRELTLGTSVWFTVTGIKKLPGGRTMKIFDVRAGPAGDGQPIQKMLDAQRAELEADQ